MDKTDTVEVKTSKKVNTKKIMESFIASIDTSKEYSLDELKKSLTEHYKSNKKSKKSSETTEKRTPSEYNIFIKEQMIKIREENPDKNNKEIMSLAASKWKEHKESKAA